MHPIVARKNICRREKRRILACERHSPELLRLGLGQEENPRIAPVLARHLQRGFLARLHVLDQDRVLGTNDRATARSD